MNFVVVPPKMATILLLWCESTKMSAIVHTNWKIKHKKNAFLHRYEEFSFFKQLDLSKINGDIHFILHLTNSSHKKRFCFDYI